VFLVKDFNHGLLIDSHHRAIGHCGCGEQTESLPCKATFPEEIALVQNAYRSFLPVLRHNGRKRTLYKEPTDWIFPSPKMGGKQPYWQDSLMRKVVWPAAKRAGITERIGWHTFRRSLATLLIDVGAPVKLTQEIMRHANSRVTLELHQQVSMTAKQALQARVVAVW
jgi:integrase